MKYNIYINQKVLSKTTLDLADATILDYLYFLCGSVSPKVDKQRVNGFTWADYGLIIKDNPMLRIKSRGAITRRIQNLKDAGFIETLEQRRMGHKFIYIKMKPLIDTLFTDMNRSQEPIHETEKPIHEKKKPIHIYEPIKTTKDNTTKDNTTIGNKVSEMIKLFEKIDIKNKTYYANKTQRAKASFLLEEYGIGKVSSIIEVYLKCKGDRFLPGISSPYDMVEKMSKLEDYFLRKKADQDEVNDNLIL